MGYTLILTEKPSAAAKLAQALAEGPVEKMKKRGIDYYAIRRAGKEIVIVPAVGHLFVLKSAEESNEWHYPVFSVRWAETFTDRNSLWAKKYFENIRDLVTGATEFVSATDYDVEGAVISYNIFRFIFKVNDGRRMKFSTLTTPDLVEAYEHASPHLEFPTIEAGLARHQLDWYFGINLTRALTLALKSTGGYMVLSTGRVQGPTLHIIEEREQEIRAFRPQPFWQIRLDGIANAQELTAFHHADKFWKKEEADGVFARCNGKPGAITAVEKKEKKQYPPVPFDLTSLQREVYRIAGYSPKQTLDIAQSLYEQALISYPRTSSQKLPAKIGYRSIISRLGEQREYAALCEQLLAEKSLTANEGNKTDPAHPAIYPTGLQPTGLNQYQKKIYDIIVRRFFSVFGRPAEREQMRVVITVEGEDFVATGIRTVTANWMAFYQPYATFREDILPEVRKGDAVAVKKLEVLAKETQPPNRYSQASILKKLEDLGLGTKATRAQILQTLYDRHYIAENAIAMTDLGEAVVHALERYSPDIISPDLTRRLEEDMEAIQNGTKKREEVIAEAESELRKILQTFKKNEQKIGGEIKTAVIRQHEQASILGPCPKCGKDLRIMYSKATRKRFVGCSGYPDCSNALPLPQAGALTVSRKLCKICGLYLVSIKTRRRPWEFCPRCNYEQYKKDLAEGKVKPKKRMVNKATAVKTKTAKKTTAGVRKTGKKVQAKKPS